MSRSPRYSREHVLGRNCRFLQGPATSPKRVAVIRRAIADGYDSSTVLLNYRADGTRTTRDRPHIPARASLVISPPRPKSPGTVFWNRFYIAPLHDERGAIQFYVGCQYDVSSHEEQQVDSDDDVDIPDARPEGAEEDGATRGAVAAPPRA